LLVMVGTVHRDPGGYARLSRILERERPDLITVEVSPYSRLFRAEESSALRNTLRENLRKIQKEEGRPLSDFLSRGAIMGIFFLLKEPFEWRAAKSYAHRYGIVIHDIDLSIFSKVNLAHLSELIAVENLRTLLRLHIPSFSEQVKTQYSRAEFLFHHPPSFWPAPKELKEREAYMAEKIRKFAQGGNGEKILHVGGWEHLIDDPDGNSLFALLQDLQPKRVLLNTFKNLSTKSVDKVWKTLGIEFKTQ